MSRRSCIPLVLLTAVIAPICVSLSLSGTLYIPPQPACFCSHCCSTYCGWRWWMWSATSCRKEERRVHMHRFRCSTACRSWWRLPACLWSSSRAWSSCWWAVRCMPASELDMWVVGQERTDRLRSALVGCKYWFGKTWSILQHPLDK